MIQLQFLPRHHIANATFWDQFPRKLATNNHFKADRTHESIRSYKGTKQRLIRVQKVARAAILLLLRSRASKMSSEQNLPFSTTPIAVDPSGSSGNLQETIMVHGVQDPRIRAIVVSVKVLEKAILTSRSMWLCLDEAHQLRSEKAK